MGVKLEYIACFPSSMYDQSPRTIRLEHHIGYLCIPPNSIRKLPSVIIKILPTFHHIEDEIGPFSLRENNLRVREKTSLTVSGF